MIQTKWVSCEVQAEILLHVAWFMGIVIEISVFLSLVLYWLTVYSLSNHIFRYSVRDYENILGLGCD
jgi:hypothetical protein